MVIDTGWIVMASIARLGSNQNSSEILFLTTAPR